MKRKIIGVIALTLCVLMAAMSLTACGGDSKTSSDSGSAKSEVKSSVKSDTESEAKSALIGTWEATDEGAEGTFYTFNADGSGELKGTDYKMNLTYVDKGETVDISYEGVSGAQTWEYTIDGEKLSLKDVDSGMTLSYTKK